MKKSCYCVALFGFVLALALPPMAAAESGADDLQVEVPGMPWRRAAYPTRAWQSPWG